MGPPPGHSGHGKEKGSQGGRGGRGKRGGKTATEGAAHPVATAEAAYPDARFQIGWQNYPDRTDKLVEWLVQHPADCAVLFNGNLDGLGTPSGKTKQEVNAAIAQLIFGKEEKYATHSDKYHDSVMSRITS